MPELQVPADWYDMSMVSNRLRQTYVNGFLDVSNIFTARRDANIVGTIRQSEEGIYDAPSYVGTNVDTLTVNENFTLDPDCVFTFNSNDISNTGVFNNTGNMTNDGSFNNTGDFINTGRLIINEGVLYTDVSYAGTSEISMTTLNATDISVNSINATSGNVGIGTTSPIPKVDVSGAVFVRNQTLTFASGGGGGDTTEDVALVFNQASNDRTLALKTDTDANLYGTYGGGGGRSVRWCLGGDDHTYFVTNVGIGTDAPMSKLEVKGAASFTGTGAGFNSTDTIGIHLGNYGTDYPMMQLVSNHVEGGWIDFAFTDSIDGSNSYDDFHGRLRYGYNNGFTFQTATTERMRIQGNGNVGIGTTSAAGPLQVKSNFVVDSDAQPHIMSKHSVVFEKGSGLNGDRWWMRYNDSNDLAFHHTGGADFFMRDGSGFYVWISFTGQHRSCIENIPSKDINNYTGLIVSADKNDYINIDSNLVRGKDAITINNSIPYVSLTSIEKDRKVFGVISGTEDPKTREFEAGIVSVLKKQTGDTRTFINSIGEGAIWVSNKNGNLESGEYITSSSIAGYGQKQDSEFLANYTVAKITMDCDFEPSLQYKKQIKQELIEYTVDASGNYLNNQNNDMLYGYKLVYPEDVSNNQYESVKTKHPDYNITLDLSNNFIKATKNILDEHGDIQWEDTEEQERAYEIRHIDLSGNILTEAEYNTKIAASEEAYIAAFVGCTYHCG